MDDAAHNELQAELRPWMLELKRYTTHISPQDSETPDVTRSEMLWVRVKASNGRSELKLLESLELLALASGVDDRLWLYLTSEAMPRKSIKIYEPRVVAIGQELKLRVDAIPTVCERLVVGGIEAVVPSKYQTVRARLERLYAAQEEAETGSRAASKIPRAQLVIPVKLVSTDLDAEIRLRQLVQVASMQCLRGSAYSPAFQNDAWRPLFRIVSIDPSTPSFLSAKTMLYLGQISACGIDIMLREHVEQLALHDEARPLVARTLQALFATASDTPPPREKQGTVSSVSVSCAIKRSTAACLFSALGRSQSIKSLTLKTSGSLSLSTDSPDERDHLWAWIGFSIFGPHASHAIEDLTIDVTDLSYQDVAVCEDLMQATADLTMLRKNGDIHPPRVQQEVSASRFCLTRPTDSTETPTVQLAPQRVLLLRQDGPFTGEWVKVLVPGCGLAWVHHGDVEIHPPRLPPSARSPPCIRKLELENLTYSSILPAQELVSVIGSNLTRLKVRGFRCEQRIDDWIRLALASCPQLEDLHLFGGDTTSGITSMRLFSDAYDRGTCHLKCLELFDLTVEDRDSMAHFFNVLRDKDHGMTKHLRVFTVSINNDAPTTPFPDFVPAMEAALQANRVLESLDIVMEYDADAQPEDGDAMCQLHEHNGEVLRTPLTLTSKLAVPSVVMGSHQATTINSSTSSSVHDLDNPMVALIFAFAGTATVRSVAFWLPCERGAISW